MSVTISIKSPALDSWNKDFTIQAALSDTVLSVKRQIQRTHPSQPGVQHLRLIYHGKLLENDVLLAEVIKDAQANETYVFHLVTQHLAPWSSHSEPARTTTPLSTSPLPASEDNAQAANSPVLPSNSTASTPAYSDTAHPAPKASPKIAAGPSENPARQDSPCDLVEITPLSHPFQYVLINGMPHLLHLPPSTVTHGFPGDGLPMSEGTMPWSSTMAGVESGMYPAYMNGYLPTLPSVRAQRAPEPLVDGQAAGRQDGGAAPVVQAGVMQHLNLTFVVQVLWIMLRYCLVVYMLSRNMGIEKAMLLALLGLVVMLFQMGRIRVLRVPANANINDFVQNQMRAEALDAANGRGAVDGGEANPQPAAHQPDDGREAADGSTPNNNDNGNHRDRARHQGPPPNALQVALHGVRTLVWSFVTSIFPTQRNQA
ncbi:hypothetical protein H4R34_001323 [Dimargaris verticillata]|uniref:Ubiquitin-like domain-containing protein n=1 Tax=Dimargaris verticillata TaxID=2761393 RepID=A0A9W8BA85_9FUNG|nr:hypothetical protein H4R34_001323 [Dimargaris verticillata]